MDYLFKYANVFIGKGFQLCDIIVSDGRIKSIGSSLNSESAEVFNFKDLYIFPGFVDVHVHLREPGFFYKETIESGTLAAAHGGYTTVCSMPNLSPAPDSLGNLEIQRDIINKSACIEVMPYGTITVGENGEKLSDMEALAPFVCGFSDDGRGVQNGGIMEEAMKKAKSLNKIISAHCEDNSLLKGGYIHDGEYARKNGHKGISSESEFKQIERDIELVKKTGCDYHVCHISTKESVELIRNAKKQGVNITCETAPHYLVLCDEDLIEDGRFKMNPPLRSKEDRQALIEGVLDGTIDMIATDHAPHSAEEKNKGLEKSLMGITGIETAFPVLYTYLVKTGLVPLERIVEMLTASPRRRFGFKEVAIKEGTVADFCVFDLKDRYKITTDFFKSKGKSSPFLDTEVFGRCKMTMKEGKTVWQEK